MLTRPAAALLAGAAMLAPGLAAGAAPAITPTSIAGAKLGLAAGDYERLLGKPYAVDQLEGGQWRLRFPKRKLTVEFLAKGKSGAGIVTWNRAYRTAQGVGPCSPASALTGAYGSSLKPFRLAGKIAAYRLGRLTFRVTAGRVTVVMLGVPQLSVFTALNAEECAQ